MQAGSAARLEKNSWLAQSTTQQMVCLLQPYSYTHTQTSLYLPGLLMYFCRRAFTSSYVRKAM